MSVGIVFPADEEQPLASQSFEDFGEYGGPQLAAPLSP